MASLPRAVMAMRREPGSSVQSNPPDRLAYEWAAVRTGWLRSAVTDAEYDARCNEVMAQADAALIIHERSAQRHQAERSQGGER
jgi:hypothetical protein